MPFAIPASVATLPWKWIGVGLLALGLIVAIILYGNARENAGEAKADAAWKAAAAKLEEQSDTSAAAADKPADQRTVDYATKLESEKEKIDEAIARGDSPLDALFGVHGPDGGSDQARPVSP